MTKSTALATLLILVTSCSSSDDSDGNGSNGGSNGSVPSKVSVVAGTPGGRGAVDGGGDQARFWGVQGMLADGDTIYVADLANGAVRALDTTSGEVSTLAGRLGAPVPHNMQKDGSGSEASFYYLFRLALMGRVLYVADFNMLRRVNLDTGAVTTVVDPSTEDPFKGQGTGLYLHALAASGDALYIAQETSIVRLDTTSDTFELIAGDYSQAGFADGTGTAARFHGIEGLAFVDSDTLFIADLCTIRKMSVSSGVVERVAGKTNSDDCVYGVQDGLGEEGLFQPLWDMTFDGQSLYVVERVTTLSSSRHLPDFGRVRRVDPTSGEVTTLAGDLPAIEAAPGEADGPSGQARFYQPTSIAADGGTVYVGGLASVRKIEGGEVTTVAGPLLSDPFLLPGPLALVEGRVLTFLDSRRELAGVDLSSGEMEVLFRHDATSFPVDGTVGMAHLQDTLFISGHTGIFSFDPAAGAMSRLLSYPQNVYPTHMTSDGTMLYVGLDDLNKLPQRKAVWRVDPADPSQPETVLDTEQLTLAGGIVHAGEKLFIADGNLIYQVDLADNNLSIVAGHPIEQGCQAGRAADARFTMAVGLATDGESLFVGDTGCHTIWHVSPDTKQVTTLAGSAKNKIFKSGQGDEAGINHPRYLTYDGQTGVLYVSDPADNVILKLE